MAITASLEERWPILAREPRALQWLAIRSDLGIAPRTLDAYSRGLAEFLVFCTTTSIDPLTAGRGDIARYVRELTQRPPRRARANTTPSCEANLRLANATVQQRLTALRLFYDNLVEEGVRDNNPVGRGRYAPGARMGSRRRGLVPHQARLPWIPDEADWRKILDAARREPIRNRMMLAFAYDAGLRREELCCLRTYLGHRAEISTARGPLFLSESRRNHADPLTPWTWSKVVRRIALAAGVPRFGTHTLRHLCLTDLAHAGWELHAIATFAGHRSPATTLQYIHLSGRELASKLADGMAQLHEWRVAALAAAEPAGHA